MSSFVSAAVVSEAIRHGRGLTLLASMWHKGPQGGLGRYQSGHIPNSLFCDPTMQLAGTPGTKAGRNPMPDIEQVQEAVRSWGLKPGRTVVVYDEGSGLMAARAWWMLRWAGIEDIRILEGGLRAWHAVGEETMVGPGNLPISNQRTLTPGHMPSVTIEDVKAHRGTLIDVRQPNRFHGRREILDFRAGHIPGAVNLPVDDFFTEDRRLKSLDDIRAQCAEVGVTDGEDVIVYSGSGNHSALAIAVLEHVGITGASHFVGGSSQWSADPKIPVER